MRTEGDAVDEQPGLTGDEPGVAGPGPVPRQRWRTIVAVVLIVLGCVLAPLAGVAVWARNQVTNIAPRRSGDAVLTDV